MPNKVDPKTNKPLHKHDYYFNTATGEKLSPKHIKEPPLITPREYKPQYFSLFSTLKGKKLLKPEGEKEINFNKKDNSKMISALSVVVIAGSIGFIFLYLFINFFRAPINPSFSSYTPSATVASVDLDLPIVSGLIFPDEFITNIPDFADIYIQSSDLNTFLNIYLLKDNFDPELVGKAKSLLNPTYALFTISIEESRAWVFLFKPNNIEEVESLIKNINHPEWKFKIIGDLLVVSSKSEVFDLIPDVREGVTPNLSLNADYARATAALQPEGQLLVVFVAKDTARDVFESVKDKNISPALANLVTSILDTNLNSMIVKSRGK